MNKLTFFALLFSCFSAFGQKDSTNAFFELHYTGCTYHSASIGHLNGLSVRPFNPGFGATLNLRASSVVSLELAYDNAFIQETVVSTGSVDQSYKRRYGSILNVFGVRVGIGKIAYNWSLQGLFGFGLRATRRMNMDSFYLNAPMKRVKLDDGNDGSITLGFRGTYNLSPVILVSLTAYTNFSPYIYDTNNPHATEQDLVKMNTRFLYFMNAGIAYRF